MNRSTALAKDHDERVKKRAYELWEREGRPHGKDKEHWSQAEEELTSPAENLAAQQGATGGQKQKRSAPPKRGRKNVHRADQ